MRTYTAAERRRVLELLEQGHSQLAAARVAGVGISSLRRWMQQPEPRRSAALHCPRCDDPPGQVDDANSYLYVLGLYLGDGHMAHTGKTWVLRLYLDNKYSRIQREAAVAMQAIVPNRVCVIRKAGCSAVTSYSRHWSCLLPQHGPGLKHDRPIRLEDWQQELMRADPRPLIRGLIHSDGCRVTNRVRGANGWPYAYPRYFFSNRSADIRQIFCDALDALDIRWRQNNAWNINVARRADVAAIDAFVGPKE